MKRYSHLIKHNKIIRNNRYFIFYDTETKEEDGGIKEIGGEVKELKKLTFKMGWALYWDHKRDFKEWFYFEDIKEFWNWLFEIIKRDNIKKLWVYAHNQDFDFKVLNSLNYLIQNEWECSFWNTSNFNFLLTFKKRDQVISFLDTMNYVRMSLKELGNNIGLQKLDVDFNNVSNKDLKTYCRRDVEIIYKFIREFLNYLEVNNLGSLKKTIAGTSYGVYKHKFLKNNTIFIHDHKDAIKLERDSYKGGRTECFKIGNIKNITSIDVNSMYSYVMRNYKIPIRLISYSNKERSGKDFIKFYKNAKKKGYLVIADINFYLPEGYNHIGVKSKIGKDKMSSLIFPIGMIRASLTSPEIDYVIEHGNILKVHRISLYESKNIFKDFVDYFYKTRQGYKKNNNLAYSMMTKLILNSLYGKFGQKNPITKALKFNDGKFEIYHKEIQDIVDNKIIYTNAYRVGSVGWYGTGEYEEGQDSFVAIPSFVSAYARMYLAKIMSITGIQGIDYIYCDTDSLFVSNQGLKRCKRAGLLGDDLGQLKEEKKGNVELKGCKDYIFDDEVKLKGIKKDAIEIDDGVYEQERFIKLKTALKYGLVKDQYVYLENKKLSRRYKKGVVKDNGFIKPYYVKS